MHKVWGAAVAAMLVTGAAQARPMTPARETAIDAAITQGLVRTGAKGLALAVVEDGKPVLVRAWGVRNIKGDPLAPDTVMYAASLTKAMFACTVMRMVDAGDVALDTSFAKSLAKPLPDYGNQPRSQGNWGDLAGDERWRTITPRMTLTHSTGFANFAFLEPDHKLRIHFAPGSRYAYSGEGLLLLQFAVEQRTGHSFIEDGDKLTFGPLGMTRTAFMWRDDWGSNTSQAWNAKGEAFEHTPRKKMRAPGSADTTITDMATFAAALVSGTGLSRRAHDEMLRPQRRITTASQFPTLQDELPQAQRHQDLSAGLGVVTFGGPQGPGFYKGGHDDTTANTMVCLRRGKRCVVILGSDVRVEPLFPELVRTALGETGAPWRWEYPEQFAP